MHEKRQHIRTAVSIKVRVWHDSVGSVVYTTRDVSDGGVFLITGGSPIPTVGTVVQGQVQGPVEDLPVVSMEVVRVEPTGIGLRFVQTSEDAPSADS